MIQPTASFKNNLQLLPSIEGLARIDLIDPTGIIAASIENQPGKQGSLSVYQYLEQSFGALNAEAAKHGLAVLPSTQKMQGTVRARTRTSTACWRSSMVLIL